MSVNFGKRVVCFTRTRWGSSLTEEEDCGCKKSVIYIRCTKICPMLLWLNKFAVEVDTASAIYFTKIYGPFRKFKCVDMVLDT